MKLDDQWILFELFSQHEYVSNYGYGNNPYPKKLKKSEESIINSVKKILKKDIDTKDFPSVQKQVTDYFYNDKLNHVWGRVPLLGPIGSSYIKSSNGMFLDLDDIEEVYVFNEDFSGSIKSKSCGWISWQLLKGDKSIFTSKSLTSDYQYIVTMNHFKLESSRTELAGKIVKYKNSKDGRTFKRFFVSNRFWFHDDLEKLWNMLPYIPFEHY